MKTSNVLASMLFASLGAAAPLNKRDLVIKTNTVVETVVVFTTVWDQQQPVAQATSAGAFYENPGKDKPSHHGGKPSSVAASSTPAYTPPVNTPSPPKEPSSVYTPPAVSTPSPVPTPSSVYTPPPAQTPSPAPEPSSVYVPPASPASSAAPAQSSASSGGGGSGEVHSGGSITMNYFSGGTGACGQPIADTDMAVALASDLFGASTYDTQTGNPTNEWCNKEVEITYNGKSAKAKIMDRCPGCTGGGFDMTPSLWEAITGGAGGASGDRLYGATWQVVG